LVFSARLPVLAGRVELGVGVKARAEPDRVAARRALAATPFGACCSATITQIDEGTNQIQRVVMSRALLR
jgi:hypothetical protein